MVGVKLQFDMGKLSDYTGTCDILVETLDDLRLPFEDTAVWVV